MAVPPLGQGELATRTHTAGTDRSRRTVLPSTCCSALIVISWRHGVLEPCRSDEVTPPSPAAWALAAVPDIGCSAPGEGGPGSMVVLGTCRSGLCPD